MNAYFKNQRRLLLFRRNNKEMILKQGGEQSLSHSYSDLVRIDFALKRIADGQYGLCCNCGGPIGDGRLASIPEAPFCLDCTTHNIAH